MSAEALDRAISWLCAAQDANDDDGFAALQYPDGSWAPSYPETTGYIIPTFYRYAERVGAPSVARRADWAAFWLCDVQLPNGAFPRGFSGSQHPAVFDTGMALLGLYHASQHVYSPRILKAIDDATQFLVDSQDDDGAWRRYILELPGNSFAPTYFVRVAWPLALVGELGAAEKACEYAYTNLNESGWPRLCVNDRPDDPLTHFIVYVARGLYEAGLLLGRDDYAEAGVEIAAMLLGEIAVLGRYDSEWDPTISWICIPAVAQLTVLNRRFGFPVDEEVDWLLAQQQPDGGLYASTEGGDYLPGCKPNWSAKFFADALMEAGG